MKIGIQSDYNAIIVSSSLKNSSVLVCGTADFADVYCVYSGFTQPFRC